jgi:hypothetical protein
MADDFGYFWPVAKKCLLFCWGGGRKMFQNAWSLPSPAEAIHELVLFVLVVFFLVSPTLISSFSLDISVCYALKSLGQLAALRTLGLSGCDALTELVPEAWGHVHGRVQVHRVRPCRRPEAVGAGHAVPHVRGLPVHPGSLLRDRGIMSLPFFWSLNLFVYVCVRVFLLNTAIITAL